MLAVFQNFAHCMFQNRIVIFHHYFRTRIFILYQLPKCTKLHRASCCLCSANYISCTRLQTGMFVRALRCGLCQDKFRQSLFYFSFHYFANIFPYWQRISVCQYFLWMYYGTVNCLSRALAHVVWKRFIFILI